MFLKVDGFFLATLIWQKIYERLLFTNIPPLKKNGTRSTLEVKICQGRILLAWLTAWKYLE